MTISDLYARTRPPQPVPYAQDLPDETSNDWMVLVLAANGAELVLDQWTSMQMSESHDGARATFEVNGLDPIIDYMRVMITDLLFVRNNAPLYRMKLVNAEDTLTRDGHVVKFDAVTYEKLLERRILHQDWVLQDGDLDAAWRLIDYTQQRYDLGIRRGTLDPGVTRQRSLSIGDTILDSVNNFAEAENGFDWWIDHDLVWWAQKPRRGTTHDVEWRWGGQAAELTRTAEMDDYASLIMTIGAQQETRIPIAGGGEDVYPPPPPQIVSLTQFPLGLWERAVSYSDVITETSLLEKANWLLNDASNVRATYKLTLEPGVWNPTYKMGDVVTLRIEGAPRLNVRVPVRIEEMEITVTADGEETINLSVRAEQPETMLSPQPIPNPAPDPLVPSGRTVQRHFLRPWDDMASYLRTTNRRLGAQERTPGL